MLRIYIILIIVGLFVSCKETKRQEIDSDSFLNQVTDQKSGSVLISGKIENSDKPEIYLYNSRTKDTSRVDIRGKFSFNIEIEGANFYILHYDNEVTRLFLSPGDDLFVQLDTEKFDESLVYTGTGSDVNNFLANNFLLNEIFSPDYQSLFRLDPSKFIEINEMIYQEKNIYLEQQNLGKGEFLKIENARILYDWAFNVINYEVYHEQLTKVIDKIDSSYYDELMNKVNLEDSSLLAVSEYTNFLRSYVDKCTSTTPDPERTKTKFEFVSRSIDNRQVQERLQYEILSRAISNFELNNIEELLNSFKVFSNNDSYIKNLNSTFEEVKHLIPGKPAYSFEYPNISNDLVSLKDFSGKYVYLDIWATWCAPCIQEIPYLDSIRIDYKNANIDFISISTDRSKKAWEQFVKSENMNGIQLYAGSRDQLSDKFQVYAIPRFILIDDEGNIVSANAPRPSGKLVEYLNSIGINKFENGK